MKRKNYAYLNLAIQVVADGLAMYVNRRLPKEKRIISFNQPAVKSFRSEFIISDPPVKRSYFRNLWRALCGKQ